MSALKKGIIWLCLFFLTANGLCAFAAVSLTYGKQNEDIQALQIKLKELGYFTGEADGYFGDETQMAISNFQTANAISPTGLADPETVERIKSENAITKKEYINASRTIQVMDVELKSGDTGKQVKKLQTLLAELGYYDLAINSTFDHETEIAVCLFQMINGLAVTGIADRETVSLLCSNAAINVKECEISIVLRYGDGGAAVKDLQMKLLELGYFTGDCSAKFGKNTQDAVIEYQKWNGLEQSGECDGEMRIQLAKGESISYSEAIAMEAVATLTEGDISPSVNMVKEQLALLGYYTGLIDTEFTHELTEAVYFFQLANGIQTTGSADKATRLLLNSGAGTTMEEFTRQMSEVPVQKGDAGHQVVLLQKRLTELGYYTGSINGTFDKNTEEAMLLFEKQNGLPETGIADTDTRIFMNSESALTYSESIEMEKIRLKEEKRAQLVELIIGEAKAAVSVPYEAGRVGSDLFGNAGLTYAVFMLAEVELSPTIALQYDTAKALVNWNEDKNLVMLGDQIFFMAEDELLTGIVTGPDTVVFASPDHGYVVSIDNFLENQDYVFVGSVHYF